MSNGEYAHFFLSDKHLLAMVLEIHVIENCYLDHVLPKKALRQDVETGFKIQISDCYGIQNLDSVLIKKVLRQVKETGFKIHICGFYG